MDFEKELLPMQSKAAVLKMASYIGSNPDRFEKLVNVYLKGPYRITQRASWPLTYCVENHPELLRPHLKRLLDFLSKMEVHDAVKRNTLRLFQFTTIPKRNAPQLMSICFRLLQTKKEPVAIKVFAMTLLHRLTEHEPELRKELLLIVEHQFEYEKKAFQHRAKKILHDKYH
jgi:hypothetical protein